MEVLSCPSILPESTAFCGFSLKFYEKLEQDVPRVCHAARGEEIQTIGREAESSVLPRAVKWHTERRVFMNGARTAVQA